MFLREWIKTCLQMSKSGEFYLSDTSNQPRKRHELLALFLLEILLFQGCFGTCFPGSENNKIWRKNWNVQWLLLAGTQALALLQLITFPIFSEHDISDACVKFWLPITLQFSEFIVHCSGSYPATIWASGWTFARGAVRKVEHRLRTLLPKVLDTTVPSRVLFVTALLAQSSEI